ncbi:methionine ABC transporter permease [Camelliibacillus cellulosilyticus]|uniref:Methionine ABC transporter permease n=1 Tax=Camelliibacillus cellulosilyticus TaxID=2174486 RepID=A0ABV9GMN2_9BACL
MLHTLFPNVEGTELWVAIRQTLYMTAISVVLTFILGTLLGLLLFLTAKGGLFQNTILYKAVSAIVNIFRSIPFIILIILLIPITMFLIGSMLGATAALPALIVGSAPFYARLVEMALREVDKGVIEAAEAMGANKWQIIWKVLLPEALPALISGITVTAIALVGFTAMAGVIGAGGLGDLAFMHGFERNQADVTIVSTVIILIIVFMIQLIGDFAVRKIDKR